MIDGLKEMQQHLDVFDRMRESFRNLAIKRMLDCEYCPKPRLQITEDFIGKNKVITRVGYIPNSEGLLQEKTIFYGTKYRMRIKPVN